jgi:hypothetical protein
MKTEAELDAMHAAIVARFPAGLTPQQYRQIILESADENKDGLVYPHSVSVPSDPFFQHSFLIGMCFDGLLAHWSDGSRRPWKDEPCRYKITDKGRKWLAELPSSAKVEAKPVEPREPRP